MSGHLKNLKSGGIKKKGIDSKMKILVDQGNQFDKFTKQAID